MKKIDTWVFVASFLVVYVGIFLILTFMLMPIGIKLISNERLLNAYAFTIAAFAYFLSAFGLRSYYKLPTSPLRLTSIIVGFQLTLNVLSIFWKIPTATEVLMWVTTALYVWIVVYVSLYISDNYFGSKTKSGGALICSTFLVESKLLTKYKKIF